LRHPHVLIFDFRVLAAGVVYPMITLQCIFSLTKNFQGASEKLDFDPSISICRLDLTSFTRKVQKAIVKTHKSDRLESAITLRVTINTKI